MKKELNMMKINNAMNLVRPTSRAKRLDPKKEKNSVEHTSSDPAGPTPFKFPLIRNAFPSRIEVLKPDITKIPISEIQQPKKTGPIDIFSSFLTNCFKSIIALGAIYVSIDFGCWNKTYLEPIENDSQDAAEEKESTEWELLANYISGRS
ncbi:uncharacterized protein LOC123307478 [Coccinella septempunctata]|uniref:uncharacterized protein LOC123307478 n=1 Tax=Coccinella septempunctata TaxID=41139 RepID=UPI001D090607|nr:uncharacterized protein LOC123307478 [Coccinella septempunctata]